MNLEERITSLEAESAIRRLKARYLNACDAKEADRIRTCFTPDAVIDFEGMGVFTVDQLVATFTEMAVTTPISDTHHGHNGEIEILSTHEARARWNLGFTTYDPRNGSFRVLAMFYDDEYRLTQDGWRISATKSVLRSALQGTSSAGKVSADWLVPPPMTA